MEQGNCSAGDNSASFGVHSEFDCANRIKLKCVSVLTGDPLLLHFCFTLRFAFCFFLHLQTTSLTSTQENVKLTAESWVGKSLSRGVSPLTFSREISFDYRLCLCVLSLKCFYFFCFIFQSFQTFILSVKSLYFQKACNKDF